jgi:hypothetical protein
LNQTALAWHLGFVNLIYGLRDPRTGEIRYVGQSTTGLLRPSRHCEDWRLRQDTPPKRSWLSALRQGGLRPEVVVLQGDVPAAELDTAETAWIAIGRAALGDRLLNFRDGQGKGSRALYKYVTSDATKAKLAVAGRKWFSGPEARAAQADRIRRANVKRGYPRFRINLAPPIPKRPRQCTDCGLPWDEDEFYATASRCRICHGLRVRRDRARRLQRANPSPAPTDMVK